MRNWAISLDEWAEASFSWLEINDDGPAGHYARFAAETKAEAVERLLNILRPLVSKIMYESDDYGHAINDSQ